MIIQGSVITLDASLTKVEVTPNPILQVNHGEDDVDLWGFSEEVTFIEDESPPIDKKTSPYYANTTVNLIMKNSGYMHGTTLGKTPKRASDPSLNRIKHDLFGLGYQPSKKEIREAFTKRMKEKAAKRDNRPTSQTIGAYPHTLNGQFVKEGDYFPYFNFPEPFFVEKTKQKVPGFEIFEDCHFYEEAPPLPLKMPTKDWIPNTNNNAFGLLFGQEPIKHSDHFVMALQDSHFYPSKLITTHYNNNMENGWRKTWKWTATNGKSIKISVGEGPMFEEAESDPESEPGSKPSLRQRASQSLASRGFHPSIPPSSLVSYMSRGLTLFLFMPSRGVPLLFLVQIQIPCLVIYSLMYFFQRILK
ncbi:uncharacterized protein LOC141647769 [Silene latifolia]|uniref:uncharacterized protein LOC141647769 n=1 Tax=Silene latifolia TaxID=37657 RepID=UPI003D76BB26